MADAKSYFIPFIGDDANAQGALARVDTKVKICQAPQAKC
jgi:hypothetical protein